MRSKVPPQSVRADRLEAFKQRGVESFLLDCRLQFMELEGTRRYLAGMAETERVHPTYLPTQASGRWSTTNPPLVNFPDICVNPACGRPKPHPANDPSCWSPRDVVMPDPDEWCLSFDWESVEARLFMGYAREEDDLAVVRQGWDLHTLTACQVFQLPLPPDARDPHGALANTAWRRQIGWQGDKDPRRQACKNLRYAVLQYGTNAHAASSIRDVEKLGLTRAQFYEAGRQLLAAKPRYTAFKRRTWGEAIQQRSSRTFLGRLRRLFPTRRELDTWTQRGLPGEAAREGLNHKIQGAVADMMNLTLISICLQLYPGQARLLVNRHDGAEIGFPLACPVESVVAAVAPAIARQWDIGGCLVPVTASGKVVGPGFAAQVRFYPSGKNCVSGKNDAQ